MSRNPTLEAWVRAHPDDWDGWRVYADWLVEHEDVRGELVHLRHRLQTAALSPEETALVAERRAALVAEHEPAWREGLVAPWSMRLEWRFGFVVGVWATHCWDSQWLGAFERLAAHPTARLLTDLSLVRVDLGDEGARALARSETLRSLTSLCVTYDAIGAEGAAALACSEALPSLTTLDLSRNRLGSEGAAALARSGALRSLATLDLRENGIGARGAAALARSETLRRCTTVLR